LAGCVSSAPTKIGPGVIRHLDYGNVLLGEHAADHQPAKVSLQLQEIVEDFRAAQIEVEVTEDLRLARWRKLAWNIPFNGLSVIMDTTTDVMVTDPNIRQLAEQLIAEVLRAAQLDGEALSPGQQRYLPQDLIAHMMTHTEQMSPYRTSMKIDFDEGRPLEVEAIFGNSLRAAQTVGAAVPKIEMLYHQLKAIDRRQQNRPQG
jgi:2-dehydropantoate 2-reductase